jgi:hypothetical protein
MLVRAQDGNTSYLTPTYQFRDGNLCSSCQTGQGSRQGYHTNSLLSQTADSLLEGWHVPLLE